MKKFIFSCMIMFVKIYAINFDQIQQWYDDGDYSRVCSTDVENYFIQTNNEIIINLYATSCLKINEINKLSIPIFKLVKSKKARENAAYFTDVLFKKKLLYYAVIDDVDISYVRLPKSDYILSMIFDKFVKKKYIKSKDSYIFREKNSDTYYVLGKKDANNNIIKMTLKTYKNEKLVSEIEYW